MKFNASRRLSVSSLVLTTALCAASGTAVGQVINEDFELLISDGLIGDGFATTLSVGDGVIAIGAFGGLNTSGVARTGAVYLFDQNTGDSLLKISPDDSNEFSYFGTHVVIDNGTLVVGAPAVSSDGDWAGAVYMYDAQSGGLIRKILPSDTTEPDPFDVDSMGLGTTVDLKDGILAIGTNLTQLDQQAPFSVPGPFFLFDAKTGQELHRITPPVEAFWFKNFGHHVAIGDGIVVVSGQSQTFSSGLDSLVVYSTITGGLLGEIIPEDWESHDDFGEHGAFAVGDGIIAIGAPGDDDFGDSSGSVYLYDADTRALIQKIYASDPVEDNDFGEQVAIDQGVLFVSAAGASGPTEKIRPVYAFDLASREVLGKFFPTEYTGRFGRSISVDQGTVVVGTTSSSPDNTKASVFTLPDSVCTADLNDDGVLDFFDISAFLTAFAAEDLVADFSGDGVFDFFDISVFLTEYSAGCP